MTLNDLPIYTVGMYTNRPCGGNEGNITAQQQEDNVSIVHRLHTKSTVSVSGMKIWVNSLATIMCNGMMNFSHKTYRLLTARESENLKENQVNSV